MNTTFSLCNEAEIKSSQDWVDFFEQKNLYLLQTYQKCLENKLQNCHLLLEDARATNSERLSMLKHLENMKLKCGIEKSLSEKL